MPLAYVANSLDRMANSRRNADWVAAQLQHPSRKLVHITGDATIVRDGKLWTGGTPSELTVFLGIDGGAPWFATPTTATEDLRDLRSLAMEEVLPPAELGILAQARSLLQWHERRGFCSNCGSPNKVADAGYRRHCDACGADHFPRTDPVVIIVVRHGDSILLGRQKSWRPGMYSALAGFVEPGETIEDAARREVFEESGIRVGEVRYAASQPWPFPSSMMIGLIGEALSTEINRDEEELEDARWFTRADALMMVERTHPEGLFATNPMAIAHHLVCVALGIPPGA